MATAAPSPVLPREILVEKIPDGVRYRFPQRQLGPLRLVGLIPVVFGLVFMAVPLTFAWQFVKGMSHVPIFVYVFLAVFVSIFLAAALKPLSLGTLVLWGHCTVELRRDWLRAVDSVGPFRNVRRARREDIRKFEVSVGKSGGAPRLFQPLENMGSLDAKFDSAKPMPVVLGYPHEWLVALGDELSQHISEANAIQAKAALPPTIEVMKTLPSETKAPMEAEEVTVQPTGSKARVEKNASGFSIALPPQGLRRGGKGMFGFSIVWCSFMTFFTTAVVFASRKSSGAMIPFFLFILFFWGIGLTMLLASLNLARRRALLIASASELRVAQQSLFGKKVWTWSRDAIQAIRADASGVVVNNKPVLELQIHLEDGTKKGLLRERDDDELAWIATLLRQELEVPAK